MSTEKIRTDLEFSERISAARKRTGLNQKDVSERTGVSVPSLSRYERGDREPTIDILKKLAAFYGVSPHWLLTGEGPMMEDSHQVERSISSRWGGMRPVDSGVRMPSKSLRPVDSPATTPEPSNVSPAPRSRLPSRDIPLISWVQAGGFVDPQAQTTPGYAEEWVETSATNSSSAFALVVSGDSMEPEFRDGDIITVDPDRAAVSGNYVVVKNGHEATFKQLIRDGSSVFLKPLNDRYPIRDMTGIEFRVVGVVVEKRKRY